MRLILALSVLCGLAFGQGVTAIGGNLVAGGSAILGSTGANTSHLVTVSLGGTGAATAGQTPDGGNANRAEATPFLLPADNPTLGTNCFLLVVATSSATRGCAVYADNAGSPTGTGNLICGGTVTSTPTANAYLSIAMTGCPSTLSGTKGTQYWVMQYITDNGNGTIATTGSNTYCPGVAIPSYISSGTLTPWPSDFPASVSTINGCYAAYVNLTYSTTDPYVLASVSPGMCDVNTAACTISVASTNPGSDANALWIFTSGDTTSGNVTAMSDSAGDTLTQRGCASASGTQWCAYSIDRVTTGVTTITCTHTNSGGSYKIGCIGVEVNGSAASSSFDKSHFDSAYINAQSFTSGATATLSQNQELLLGFNVDFQSKTPGAVLQMTTSAGWNIAWSGASAGAAPNPIALFYQTVNTTPTTYTLTGVYPADAASNNQLPGLVTIR